MLRERIADGQGKIIFEDCNGLGEMDSVADEVRPGLCRISFVAHEFNSRSKYMHICAYMSTKDFLQNTL